MTIEIQYSRSVSNDAASEDLLEHFRVNSSQLGLDEAIAYYGYPRYRGDNDVLTSARVLLISPLHGVFIFGTVNSVDGSMDEINSTAEETEEVSSLVFGKLLGNKELRINARTLSFPINGYLYLPYVTEQMNTGHDLVCLQTVPQLTSIFEAQAAIPIDKYNQIVATLDGSRNIPRPKKRDIAALSVNAKGRIVSDLESELARFDSKQREGTITNITGPQRIRGLAGSGKTIVLTRKASLTHLEAPDAKIAYTFHTKSLYQQIRRLITRFYRSEHDRDPDWDQVSVLHSWGGKNNPGIYSVACEKHGITPLTFLEAKDKNTTNPFRYACRTLLDSTEIRPVFDYIFIDEGQDFPLEFIKLCSLLARDMKFVYAYDDLQSIFQERAPEARDILGDFEDTGSSKFFERDIVLYKCYRNPLEVLICAHAIGFGIYGVNGPVQLLENQEHWEDLGYKVTKGPLSAGVNVEICRPVENSIRLLSDRQSIDELIEVECLQDIDEEVISVTNAINSQVQDGLRPDDIVVAVVDDRFAKTYLKRIASRLFDLGLACNNIHEAYGVPEFQLEDRITLTTVHKAKGNEGFAVHVVGADAQFNYPSKLCRNRLFTAMTRTKGWLRVTGVGNGMKRLAAEINLAKQNIPFLKFQYPPDSLDLMKRDLSDSDAITMEHERFLDGLSDEQIRLYLERRNGSIRIGKKGPVKS